jgi:hypothetical protein
MTKSPSEFDIDAHNLAVLTAFAAVRKAEQVVDVAIAELKEQERLLRPKILESETLLRDAWLKIEHLMVETGEVELILPGEFYDFKIGYGATRDSVKVVDPAAVPDEYVKLERKPLLKEIGEYLRGLRDGSVAMPNWAALERSPPKLGYKVVKKSHRGEAA